MAYVLGDAAAGKRLVARSLEWAKAKNDQVALAEAYSRQASILKREGELAEAAAVLRERVLPVLTRLGDAREAAVVWGQLADSLQARGEWEEALRIRREEELPVYERLGDVRSKALTMGKIADILQARGQLEEALRIRREEQLPVFERFGFVRDLIVGRAYLALDLLCRGKTEEDAAEIVELLTWAAAEAEKRGFPEASKIRQILKRLLAGPAASHNAAFPPRELDRADRFAIGKQSATTRYPERPPPRRRFACPT